jgi:hypothetical protein
MREFGALLCFIIVVCNAVLVDCLFCRKYACLGINVFFKVCTVEVLVACTVIYICYLIEYIFVSWYCFVLCCGTHIYYSPQESSVSGFNRPNSQWRVFGV